MTDTQSYWPAVKLGSDGINLVGDAEMESICTWLVELAESTTGGQLQDLYPGYFFTTFTQVTNEYIYSYILKFFPLDVVMRGGIIEDSEEQFRIDIVSVTVLTLRRLSPSSLRSAAATNRLKSCSTA